jgi:hypothetical protein
LEKINTICYAIGNGVSISMCGSSHQGREAIAMCAVKAAGSLCWHLLRQQFAGCSHISSEVLASAIFVSCISNSKARKKKAVIDSTVTGPTVKTVEVHTLRQAWHAAGRQLLKVGIKQYIVLLLCKVLVLVAV